MAFEQTVVKQDQQTSHLDKHGLKFSRKSGPRAAAVSAAATALLTSTELYPCC